MKTSVYYFINSDLIPEEYIGSFTQLKHTSVCVCVCVCVRARARVCIKFTLEQATPRGGEEV
jgi:hypothetical protein